MLRPAGRWPPAESSYGWDDTASGADSASESAGPACLHFAGGSAPPGSSPRSLTRGRGVALKADGSDGTGGRRSSGSRSLYSPVVHCGSIRQAAAVLAMSELGDGDPALGALQAVRTEYLPALHSTQGTGLATLISHKREIVNHSMYSDVNHWWARCVPSGAQWSKTELQMNGGAGGKA